MQKFEYKTLSHVWNDDNQSFNWVDQPEREITIDDRLNELGKDGWEKSLCPNK